MIFSMENTPFSGYSARYIPVFTIHKNALQEYFLKTYFYTSSGTGKRIDYVNYFQHTYKWKGL